MSVSTISMTAMSGETASRARQLADRFWEQLLELDPILGTQIGDERFDDRLPDPSDEGVARRASVYQGVLDQLARPDLGLDRAALGVDDRTALDVAEAIARSGLDAVAYRLDRFRAVSHLFGPAQLLAELGSLQRADTPERAERYLARLAAVPAFLSAVGEVARAGAASRSTAPALVVDRAIGQVERLLSGDPASCPGMSPLPEGTPARSAAAEVMRDTIWPAYQGYLAALRAYRGAARESIGACDLPDGQALYASQILAHTTLPLTAEEVHATGLAELAAIREEEREIAGRLGHADAASALAAHTAAGGNIAATRAELLARAERQVRQAWDAAGGWFGRLPGSPCEVRPVEAFREHDMPPALYIPATGDGSRPGIYYINLAHLDAVPLHMLATISYHEANPGHHFQISIEQEFTGRSPLRRFGGIQAGTAFAEGWGLYCERLADQMGLYESEYERLGMLGAQAWRAVRLVVDSGIHALGWDRRRAIDLCVSIGLPAPTAEVEVDRYISWPGQALAYKIGQLELQSLRAEAARRPGFTISGFHDRVLELGTLPLPALRREMASV